MAAAWFASTNAIGTSIVGYGPTPIVGSFVSEKTVSPMPYEGSARCCRSSTSDSSAGTTDVHLPSSDMLPDPSRTTSR